MSNWKEKLAGLLKLMAQELSQPDGLPFVAATGDPSRIQLPTELVLRLRRLDIQSRSDKGSSPGVLSAFCDHAIMMCQHASAAKEPATAAHINRRFGGKSADYDGLFIVLGTYQGAEEPLRTMLYRTAVLVSGNHPVILSGDGQLVTNPLATSLQLAHWAVVYAGYVAMCGPTAGNDIVASLLACSDL